MAQGEFTKEEAKEIEGVFKEVFTALSKPKQREFLGHANDIWLFVAAAGRAAPTEAEVAEAKAKAEQRGNVAGVSGVYKPPAEESSP